ncbi:MAG: aromatic ring-hydroxylating dioxygenase subunit alpha [Ilumatobacteraceae bacterium]
MTADAASASPLDVDALVEPGRVHRRLYVDPEVFALERSQVFAASWCFVAHESQIPASGDFVTTDLGGRSVIVTRDGDGVVHALLNRCTHRGTELTTAEHGCSKRFSCPYHGWTFAADGRLVALPFPGDHPGHGDGSLDLGRLAVGRYRGFVFATLNADPLPIDEWLGPARPWLDELIDRHPGGELAVAPTAQKMEYRGNWKLSWDNAADGLHATFAHRSYNVLGRAADVSTVLARDPASTPMVARALPYGHMVVDQRPGIPKGPWSTMRPMPFADDIVAELSAEPDGCRDLDLATGSMLNVSLFPNLIFVGNQLMVVQPLAVDRTRLVMYLTFAAQARPEVNLLRVRTDEDFVNFGTPDDLEMFERAQRGLAIPEVPWIDVGRGTQDRVEPDGSIVGPITSESAQRSYLRHYRTLMSDPAPLVAR